MVNGQRWPGSCAAHTGYGTPGAVSIDGSGELVVAKQHQVGGVVNGGTQRLYAPLNPRIGQFSTTALPLGLSESTEAFLQAHPFGGVGLDLARSLAYESLTLMSPAVVDLHMGRRIAAVKQPEPSVVYADDSFIKFHPLLPEPSSKENSSEGEPTTSKSAQPSHNQSPVDEYLDMRSPVLQIDDHGLIRTQKGLAVASSPRSVAYFQEGQYMHATSSEGGLRALGTTVAGEVQLLDVETGQKVWRKQQPRGSVSGWAQTAPLDAQHGMWCNRYTMACLDFREPPGSAAGSHIVLDYQDRQREIRGIGDNGQGDVFALTSYQLLWICGGSQGVSDRFSPTLTVEHPIARNDWSTSLFVGQTRGRSLVTLASQISPLVTAAFFDRNRDGLPMLMDDLYYLESWPTIAPQSHITVETQQGFDIYSVGNDGGLFQQHWIETGTSSRDDLVDLPPVDQFDIYDARNDEVETADEADAANGDAEDAETASEADDADKRTTNPGERGLLKKVNTDAADSPYSFTLNGVRYRPFDLIRPKAATESVDFTQVYARIFASTEKKSDDADDDELSTTASAKFAQLGVASAAELQEVCERQWLYPQRSRLSREAVAEIEQQIHNMARGVELALTNNQPVICRTDAELGLGREEQAILDLWPLDGGNDTEMASSQPSLFSQSSQAESQWSQPLTQPAPATGLSSFSQPSLSQPTLSQPSLGPPMLSQPTLGMSKKRKHKKRKHK